MTLDVAYEFVVDAPLLERWFASQVKVDNVGKGACDAVGHCVHLIGYCVKGECVTNGIFLSNVVCGHILPLVFAGF
jgi:hypothetical protein